MDYWVFPYSALCLVLSGPRFVVVQRPIPIADHNHSPVALRCQVVDVPVVQVLQFLRSCLNDAIRDPTVQLVVFVLGQVCCRRSCRFPWSR